MAGANAASGPLFANLYAELHRVAKRELFRAGGRPPPLGATTLVHEVYLDISVGSTPAPPDRPGFLRYAARVMRGLIIDRVRHGKAQKRGGHVEITDLADSTLPCPTAPDPTWMDAALEELAAIDPALAEIVELKFFRGHSLVEIAAMRGVSERTAQRNWESARQFLRGRLLPQSRLGKASRSGVSDSGGPPGNPGGSTGGKLRGGTKPGTKRL